MGLVVERKPGESIHIQFDQRMSAEELDDLLRTGITIRVVDIGHQVRPKAKLHIEAGQGARIWRSELLERATHPHQNAAEPEPAR